MDTNKLIAIAGAFLIATGGVAGIRAYADASARAVMNSPAAEAQAVQTLPTITVHPSRAELDAARHPSHALSSDVNAPVSGGGFVFDMPYYSFAVKSSRASKG